MLFDNQILRHGIEEVLAIIELKYKGSIIDNNVFYNDVIKFKEYGKAYPHAQLYAGFIQESLYNDLIVHGLMADRQANGQREGLQNYWVTGMKLLRILPLR